MLITKLWVNDIQFSLKFALEPWEDLDIGEGFCSACFEAAQEAYDSARTTNWDQLKTYFGLCDLEDMLDWEESRDSDSDSSQSDAGAE